jgi:uncharacterized membrane protein
MLNSVGLPLGGTTLLISQNPKRLARWGLISLVLGAVPLMDKKKGKKRNAVGIVDARRNLYRLLT